MSSDKTSTGTGPMNDPKIPPQAPESPSPPRTSPKVTFCLEMHGPTAQGGAYRNSHKEMVLAFIKEFGGQASGTTGRSVSAYFPDCASALKSAVKIQQYFSAANLRKAENTQIHGGIGIHFGGADVAADKAGGAAGVMAKLAATAGVAAKLAEAAGPSQILVSRQVCDATLDPSLVRFDAADPGRKGTIPGDIAVYKALWDKNTEPSPSTGVVLYFRPLHGLGSASFPSLWSNLAREAEIFSGEAGGKKFLLPDNTLGLVLRNPKSTVPALHNVLKVLRDRTADGSEHSFLPVHVFIRTCRLTEEDPSLKNGNLPSDGINPGDIYISADAYRFIGSQANIPLVAGQQGGPGGSPVPSWHQVALNREPHRDEGGRFLYQEALARGREDPCFYCGSKRHKTGGCPSKHLLESTGFMNKIGYLSLREINALFLQFVSVESQDPEKYGRELREGHTSRLGPAFYAFYELNEVFQLRFFRSIWYCSGDEWGKFTESKDQPKGGLQWLALDSLRVSDLVRAESMLKEARLKNPEDYRVYCTMGYLYVERGDLIEAEYFFKKALKCAKAKTSKIFIHLLLSRLNRLLGRLETAHRNITDILYLDSRCPEAVYQDIVFRLQEGNEKTALPRLIVLMGDERKYYVQALIDPDLAPFRNMLNEQMNLIFSKAREDAQSEVRTADAQLEQCAFLLREKDLQEIGELRAEVERLLATDSYFGYLDAIRHADTLISICRNAAEEQKQESLKILDRLKQQTEKDMAFVLNYSFPRLTNSYYKKLGLIKERVQSAREAPLPTSAQEFEAYLAMREGIAAELSVIESDFSRLEMLRQTLLNAFRFVRNSIILMTIVLLIGIFLLPVTAHYFNVTLSRLEILTASDVEVYQKYFIVFGGVASLIISFLLTVKSIFKNDRAASRQAKRVSSHPVPGKPASPG